VILTPDQFSAYVAKDGKRLDELVARFPIAQK
jgi:hypothetical protein